MTELEQLLEKLASRDLVIEQMRETLKKLTIFTILKMLSRCNHPPKHLPSVTVRGMRC